MRKLVLVLAVLGATAALAAALKTGVSDVLGGDEEPPQAGASYPLSPAPSTASTEPPAARRDGRLGVTAPGATAVGRDFFVGFSDTAAFLGEPAEAVPLARRLGARAFRVTLTWQPGQSAIGDAEAEELARLAAARDELRAVVAVHGVIGTQPPITPAGRDQFCAYAASVLERAPGVTDIVIWNEPNKSHFWRPQFNADGSSAAPAAYMQLLTRCWDVLHAVRPNVNVVAPATAPRGNDDAAARSNVSHSPGNFIRKLGEAYRASGRTKPIFDTVGHHVYGEHAAERPWKRHALSGTIGLDDWDELMQALWDGFNGTAQPLRGACSAGRCPKIWYLEAGYQTLVDDAVRDLYRGSENEKHALPDVRAGAGGSGEAGENTPAPDQATQVTDAIARAACQPHVEAFFNFLVWDEAALDGWQSAPLWVDRTPKDSYGAFERAIAQATAGSVNCGRLQGPTPPSAFKPRTNVDVLKVQWPKQQAFDPRNSLWRFRITTAEDAIFVARIRRSGGRGLAVATRSGTLKEGHNALLTVSKRRLRPGRYRMEVTLVSADNSKRRTTARGPVFRVGSIATAGKRPAARRR